ncbi:MAG: hypothetical protein AAB546_00445 [Patescibacteria group bacterium]
MNGDQIQKLETLQKIFRYFFRQELPQFSGELVMPSSMDWTEEGFKNYVLQVTGTKTITEAKNILFDPVKNSKIPPVYLETFTLSEKASRDLLNNLKPEDQPTQTVLDKTRLEELQQRSTTNLEERKRSQEVAAKKQSTFMEAAQATAKSQVQTQVADKPIFVVAPEEPEIVKQQLRQQAREVFAKQIYLEPVKQPEPIILTKQTLGILATIGANEIKNSEKTVQEVSAFILQPKNIPDIIKNLYSQEEIGSISGIVARDILRRNRFFWEELNRAGIDPAKITGSLAITPKNSDVAILKASAELYPETEIANLALATAVSEDTFHAFASAALGPQAANVLYGENRELQQTDTPSTNSTQVNIEKLIDFSKEAKNIFSQNKQLFSKGQNPLSNILKQFESVKIETPTNSDIFNFFQSIKDLFATGSSTTAVALGATGGVGAGTFVAYQFYSPTLFSAWNAQAVLAGKITAFDMPAYQTFVSSLSPAQQTLRMFSLGQFTSPVGSMFLPTEIAGMATPTTLASATASSTGVIVTEAGVVGTSLVTAEAGAAAGTALLPVVGTIIGAAVGMVVSWVASKINWAKVKKFFQENKYIGPTMVAGGILMMFGGGVVTGGLIATAGVGATAMGSGGIVAGLSAIPAGIAGVFGLALATSLRQIAKPIIISLITIPFVIALIIFIINSSAYVIPGSTSISGGGVTPVGGCEGVVTNGTSITSSLQKGFWQFYNHSPQYDHPLDNGLPCNGDHWSESYYASYPNPCASGTDFPAGCKGTRPVACTLFWCTDLIMKTYLQSGFEMPQNMFAVVTMRDWFQQQNRLLSADTPATEIPIGSAIFFGVGVFTPGPLSHVALVSEVNQDYITIIESNNSVTTRKLTVSLNGKVQGGVVGYGVPPLECNQQQTAPPPGAE